MGLDTVGALKAPVRPTLNDTRTPKIAYMTDPTKVSAFRFSEGFDVRFLDDLYAGDTLMAEEVFLSSLDQLEESITMADLHVILKDTESLRRVIHRMKPVFGYMGLLFVQELVQQFEERCVPERRMEELETAWHYLRQIMCEANRLARKECTRLNEFNRLRA
jgi:HPt (histidine-containing phosphotransfer) domain-containing protein